MYINVNMYGKYVDMYGKTHDYIAMTWRVEIYNADNAGNVLCKIIRQFKNI